MDTVTIIAILVFVLAVCMFYLGMFWQRVETRREKEGVEVSAVSDNPPTDQELEGKLVPAITLRRMVRKALDDDFDLRRKVLSGHFDHQNLIRIQSVFYTETPLSVVKCVLKDVMLEELAAMGVVTND